MFKSKKALVAAIMTGFMSMQVAAVTQAADKPKVDPKPKKVVLKVDRYDLDQLPRNYRKGSDQFPEKAATKIKTGILPSRVGMDTMNYSASSCMSEKEFENVLLSAPVNADKFYDIDLRGESHGYLDGMAVSWFNNNDWGNDGREQFIIESIEKDQLKDAFKHQPISIHKFADKGNNVEEPFEYTATTVRTEEQMVKEHGAKYLRLALLDHFRPDDSDVDRFLTFYKQLPSDAWLHYHCYAGVGRTAVFATMHDIIKSAGNGVSFDDIIARQYLIGPTNLASWEGKNNWKMKSYKERYIFLRQFYDYVQAHKKLDLPYSQWAKEHGYDSLDPDYSGYIWRIEYKDQDKLPRNFRTAQSKMDEISPKALKSKGVKKWLADGHKISEKGLREMKMSGSSELTYKTMARLKTELQKLHNGPIVIMDLREETHGFVNGVPMSWYGLRDWGNYGKSYEEVIKDENARIHGLKGKKIVASTLSKEKLPENPQTIIVDEAITEKELCERMGLGYFRITATDHIFPTPENVDKFINFYKKMPKNTWLHYHCQAGAGRTTAYMVMQDMMENPDVPMFDILLRQNMIGGNFTAYTSKGNKKGEWKADYYNHKAKYIKLFYKYCQKEAKNNFKTPWSKWLEKNDVLKSKKKK